VFKIILPFLKNNALKFKYPLQWDRGSGIYRESFTVDMMQLVSLLTLSVGICLFSLIINSFIHSLNHAVNTSDYAVSDDMKINEWKRILQ
jgi:hypothetical protein